MAGQGANVGQHPAPTEGDIELAEHLLVDKDTGRSLGSLRAVLTNRAPEPDADAEEVEQQALLGQKLGSLR
jgi:hypothetical protein